MKHMSNTKELERLYCALGDFISAYFHKRCTTPGKGVSREFLNAVRDASLNSFNDILRQLENLIGEHDEPPSNVH